MLVLFRTTWQSARLLAPSLVSMIRSVLPLPSTGLRSSIALCGQSTSSALWLRHACDLVHELEAHELSLLARAIFCAADVGGDDATIVIAEDPELRRHVQQSPNQFTGSPRVTAAVPLAWIAPVPLAQPLRYLLPCQFLELPPEPRGLAARSVIWCHDPHLLYVKPDMLYTVNESVTQLEARWRFRA